MVDPEEGGSDCLTSESYTGKGMQFHTVVLKLTCFQLHIYPLIPLF